MGINLPKLDDIGYAHLRQEAQARLPKSAPQWSDHNLSDPGITFMELFAWLGDVELYRLNRVTRTHLGKFLALLGDRYPTARAATGMIARSAGVDADVRIAANRAVTLEVSGKAKAFRTRKTFYGNPAAIGSVTVLGESGTYTTRTLDSSGTPKPFYAFGESPAAGTLFRLNLTAMPPKRLKLYVLLEESGLPDYAEGWQEDIAWLTARDTLKLEWRLVIGSQSRIIVPREDCTLNLRYSGTLSFIPGEAIVPDDGSPVALECRLKQGSYAIAPYIQSIYLNAVEIEQARTAVQNAAGSVKAGQCITIEQGTVLDANGEGIRLETQSGSDAPVTWKRVDSLLGSQSDDRHFVYDNTIQEIRLGDAEHGAVIAPEDSIAIYCSVSEGTQGNVPQTCTWPLEGLEFFNPAPIQGGDDLPTIEERFAAIKATMQQPAQAVTLNDYETLALLTPGLRVARAQAKADTTENSVSVTVVPYSRSAYPMPDDFFCTHVCRFLDGRRLITTRISVAKPRYTDVGVTLRLTALHRFDLMALRETLVDTLNGYLHPLHGGDGGTGWPFGRAIYLSDIHALIDPIEGVECLLDVSFTGTGNYSGSQKAYVIAEDSLIRVRKHRITFLQSTTACKGSA